VATRYVAFVPARGGSKGVPRKNLELVGSQSLVERAVLSGRASTKVSACHVSSDDQEILAKAVELGAQAHLRSTLAAADSARASEVMDDFLSGHAEIDDEVRIVYLQPTSPFRTSAHVDRAINAMESAGVDALVGVVRSHQLPGKTLVINDSGALALGPGSLDPGENRQSLPPSVYPNGALYIFSVGAFRERGDIPVIGAYPFLMGKVESLDIDDPEDLILARGVAASAGI
jgi:CMP-N,N'-diacetyllegionaminic acid synthase